VKYSRFFEAIEWLKEEGHEHPVLQHVVAAVNSDDVDFAKELIISALDAEYIDWLDFLFSTLNPIREEKTKINF
jgi:hypothetical protein